MKKNWNPSIPNSIETLQIIYKVAERCNINCLYCYYFNMGDDSAFSKPPLATIPSVIEFSKWLAKGAEELCIKNVNISFHGGEPMLVKPRYFEKMCETFQKHVGAVANVRFSMQTNGTIFNDEWLKILIKFRVSIGVSIDGSKVDHDRYRLDHKGKSTFLSTETTIKTLVRESKKHPFLQPSTISVLDSKVNYISSYMYLRSLGVKQMSFLFPDKNANDVTGDFEKEAVKLGSGLLQIFNEWILEDNPDVKIRYISRLLNYFDINSTRKPIQRRRKINQILVARSDNTIAIDDSYIPALDWYSKIPDFHVSNFSLKEVLSSSIFQSIELETNKLPDDCTTCRWKDICRGGDLENRFSVKSGFNNSSIYCEAYKTLYSGVCTSLVDNGYPKHEISNRF